MKGLSLNLGAFLLGLVLPVSLGFAAVPLLFHNHVFPGVEVGPRTIGGVPLAQLPHLLGALEQELLAQEVIVQLLDKQKIYALRDLGVGLDDEAIIAAASEFSLRDALKGKRSVPLAFTIASYNLQERVGQDFAGVLQPPVNATLTVTQNNTFVTTKSASGEAVDVVSLANELGWRAHGASWENPVALQVVQSPPLVHEGEVAAAQSVAEQLLASGVTLYWQEQEWIVPQWRVRQLLTFEPVPDPQRDGNFILGLAASIDGLVDYLDTTVAPAINQEAVDARFTVQSDNGVPQRVTQFATAQDGLTLNTAATAARVREAVHTGEARVELDVAVTKPTVSDVADASALGVRTLLATGVSDFKGSSASRAHNIKTGVDRYHGVLVPPGEEFKFNELLGPVTGAAGFKPELVIKNNATIPEFGGGLCQVSTTAFRAAINAGLGITERRNHSYAVSYYGTPGFDATIYPGHTDFRFINNTPGYILIQAQVVGTRVIFDFWGTDDGRVVEVEGPHPYGRQPDGSVKATLKQTVVRDGEVIIEDDFYSRYKSPSLYPRTEEGI